MRSSDIGPGLFITLEGGEGSGKSTQGRKLASHFEDRGYPVILTSEPGGTDIGRQLRQIVLSSENRAMVPEAELLIYMADRAQHVKAKIIPAIRRGDIVISDRYNDSSMAYQHYARGVPRDVLDFLFTRLTGGLHPDITLVLDLSPELGMRRIDKRTLTDPDSMSRFEEEELVFHRSVRNGFLDIAKREPERVRVVSGEAPEDAVFQEILSALKPVISAYVSRRSP